MPMIPRYVLKALFVTAGLWLARMARECGRETQRRWAAWLFRALAGQAALLTANALGALKGLGVGLNGVTVAVSALLGAPGVSLLWAVKYLL